MFSSSKSQKTSTTLKLKPGSGNNNKFNDMQQDDKVTYSRPIEFGVENLNVTDNKIVKEFLISRCAFNINDTINKYPCRFSHSHKQQIYGNIVEQQNKKYGQINSEKVCYFTRWKQLDQGQNELNTLNEETENGDDLNAKFTKTFGKEPVAMDEDIDIENNTESKDKDKDDLSEEKENELQRKSITIHSYEENVFEYNDNQSSDHESSESKSNDDIKSIAWYLNFAHSNLFIAYRGALLAQDELQVLEHPFLGSIRECMVNKGKGSKENIAFLSRITAYSTPCLFTNVPRQCIIDTMSDPNIKGRERGILYVLIGFCNQYIHIDLPSF